MKKEKAVEEKSRRPGSVTVAGWCAILAVPLALGRITYLLLAGELEAMAAVVPTQPESWLTAQGVDTLALIVIAPVALLSLVAGIGILKRRSWAWVALMLFLVLALMLNLLRTYLSEPEYVLMLVYSVLALLLNQPDVRQEFRIGRPSHEPVE